MRNRPCGFVMVCGATLLAGTLGWQPAVAADSDLDWLAGQWCSQGDGMQIEESWLPAVGGSLHGLSRTTKGGQVRSFEFMWIARIDGVPTFHASPNGMSATAFARSDGGADWVRFENVAHDFPNRIDYRTRAGRLLAEISGPGRDGKPMTIGFDYARCNPAAGS